MLYVMSETDCNQLAVLLHLFDRHTAIYSVHLRFHDDVADDGDDYYYYYYYLN